MATSKLSRTIYSELFPSKLKKSDQTKIRILEATIEIYSDLGAEQATYEDIAQKAGITRPLVQHYFPNKKDLFLLALQYVSAVGQMQVIEPLQTESRPDLLLKEYIRSHFTSVERNPSHWRAWLFFYYACATDTGLRSKHRELTQIGYERIMELLELGVRDKVFSRGRLPVKARAIQRILTGGIVELFSEHGLKEVDRIREEIVDLCLKVASD